MRDVCVCVWVGGGGGEKMVNENNDGTSFNIVYGLMDLEYGITKLTHYEMDSSQNHPLLPPCFSFVLPVIAVIYFVHFVFSFVLV